MAGPKTTCFVGALEVVDITATQVAINQPPLPPPPQRKAMNPEVVIRLHTNLVHTPQVDGYV